MHGLGLKNLREPWLPAWRLWHLWVTQDLLASVGDMDLIGCFKASVITFKVPPSKSGDFFLIKFLGPTPDPMNQTPGGTVCAARNLHFKEAFMLLKDWLKSHSSEWSLDQQHQHHCSMLEMQSLRPYPWPCRQDSQSDPHFEKHCCITLDWFAFQIPPALLANLLKDPPKKLLAQEPAFHFTRR